MWKLRALSGPASPIISINHSDHISPIQTVANIISPDNTVIMDLDKFVASKLFRSNRVDMSF